jgi:hypothetical protein
VGTAHHRKLISIPIPIPIAIAIFWEGWKRLPDLFRLLDDWKKLRFSNEKLARWVFALYALY